MIAACSSGENAGATPRRRCRCGRDRREVSAV